MAIGLVAAEPPEGWATSMTAAQMVRANIFAILVPMFILQLAILLMASQGA